MPILKKNIIPRLVLLILIAVPFYFWHEFYVHFYVYLTGNVITTVITQQWHVVLISILVFMAFLIPLSYRKKANWANYGLVTAFFVSLFIEMYGIPFTILFASKYFFSADAVLPDNVINFDFFGVGMGMDHAMLYGAILMIIGAILICVGWVSLYRSVKSNTFVKSGIYSISRHPQYLGFLLVIIGWFVGWPTIITLVFTPILIYKYIKVSLTEEREMKKIDPSYNEYASKTPFMI